MNYNPNIHKRQSIRLKGYDYSQAGLYFITICIQNRVCLLGDITNGKMILNDAGTMVKNEWLVLPNRFSNIKLHEYTVMPNHFHAILQITDADTIVGASLVVAQNINVAQNTTVAQNTVVDENVVSQNSMIIENELDIEKGYPRGVPRRGIRSGTMADELIPRKTLGDMVGAFQSITTNEYIRGVKNNNWPRFNKKLWQRNYWEHIIRNETAYYRIANYIIENPSKWNNDKLNLNE